MYFESRSSSRSSSKLTNCSLSINRKIALLLAKFRAYGLKSPSVTSRQNSELATLPLGTCSAGAPPLLWTSPTAAEFLLHVCVYGSGMFERWRP